MEKVGKFTQRVVSELRQRLSTLQPKADKAAQTEGETPEKAALMEVRAVPWMQRQHHADCACLHVCVV